MNDEPRAGHGDFGHIPDIHSVYACVIPGLLEKPFDKFVVGRLRDEGRKRRSR